MIDIAAKARYLFQIRVLGVACSWYTFCNWSYRAPASFTEVYFCIIAQYLVIAILNFVNSTGGSSGAGSPVRLLIYPSVLNSMPFWMQRRWAANRPAAEAPGRPPGGTVHIPAMMKFSRPGRTPGKYCGIALSFLTHDIHAPLQASQ